MGLGDQRRDSMMNEDMTHFGQGGQQGVRLISLRSNHRLEEEEEDLDQDSDLSDDEEDSFLRTGASSSSPMGLDGSLENDADSFWNEDYASATMRQFKDTRTTADFVHRRIDAERIEEANPLCGKRPDGTYGSLYTSANVFPDWIKTRGDFEEVDRIIKEQHLSRALKALPHLRAASDLDLVSAFVLTSWRKAQELGPKRVALIAKCVSYFFVQAGDYILNEGESSRTFYIIVTGEVYIHKKAAMSAGHDGIVATLKAGQSFGEIALEMGGGCTASVVAKTEVELLVLYKSDYDQIMKDYKEQERADALHILKNIPMFKNWARSRLERVAQLLQRKRFDAGTPIIKQGDPPDNVYFIHEGVCEVTKDITIERTNCWPTGPKTWKKVVRKKKVPFKILDLHRGGFFGEKAIIEDNVRAATVSALTDVWVFYVDKIEFMSLLNMGYKAQSDAAGGVQGYPNDEDILNLFSSLNVGGPKKKTLVKVQKPKKKAKDSAAGKKEGGGRRVTTAPFGATRSPKAFTPKGSAVVRTPMRQQEQQQQGSGGGDGGMFFGDDMLPMPELGMQRRPLSLGIEHDQRFERLRSATPMGSDNALPSVYRSNRSAKLVGTPATPATAAAATSSRRIKTPKFVQAFDQSQAYSRLDGVRSTTNQASSAASLDLTSIASPLTTKPRNRNSKKHFS